jgi:hexokinase
MEKAMELANSIASMNLDVRVNAVINDKTAELARITAE